MEPGTICETTEEVHEGMRPKALAKKLLNELCVMHPAVQAAREGRFLSLTISIHELSAKDAVAIARAYDRDGTLEAWTNGGTVGLQMNNDTDIRLSLFLK